MKTLLFKRFLNANRKYLDGKYPTVLLKHATYFSVPELEVDLSSLQFYQPDCSSDPQGGPSLQQAMLSYLSNSLRWL